MERYARQEAIPGWDQRRLSEATTAIAGNGPMALLTALMAAAMGFGRLVLIGAGPKGDGSNGRGGGPTQGGRPTCGG